jgi:phosphate transport system substrate-binding protein
MGAMLGLAATVRAACTIAAIITCHSQIAASEVLRIGGTGAANGMIKSVGTLFTAQTGIAVQLVPSLGTNGGNRALANGVIDAAISGRPLTAAEIANGLTTVAEFHTPFGLVTSHPNPNGFKSGDIARIFQSDNPTWADGTPMRIILRPTTDSDTWLLGHLFPGMTEAMAAIRKRADLSVAATDQDNADMAEQTPGSLTGATFTQMKMEKRKLRFVAIDGTAPSLESYKSGAYPFGKSLYLVLGAKKSPACERFLAFLRSPDGVTALHEAGIVLRRE